MTIIERTIITVIIVPPFVNSALIKFLSAPKIPVNNKIRIPIINKRVNQGINKSITFISFGNKKSKRDATRAIKALRPLFSDNTFVTLRMPYKIRKAKSTVKTYAKCVANPPDNGVDIFI